MKKTFLLGAVAACGFAVSAAAPFDVVALVDSLDFAHVYDIETATGTVQTLEHVLLTHPTTVLWRDKGGSLMRYPSAEEASPVGESPLDKRKLPRLSVYGNLRLERPEPDAFGIVRGECARRGLVYGIHTTWEENHWLAYTESNWNVAHPQFMCRTRRGGPRLATASLAWPEVRAHKLRLVDERLALKPQVVFLDLHRNGGWSPRMEYVKPVIDRWRAKFGCEPPSDARDPRWLALVGEDVMSYLRAFAAKCHAAGAEFHLGFKHLDLKDDYLWRMMAVDWKALAADGTLDAVVLMDVDYDPKRAYESTREILSYAKAHCGKARLYFHCSTYAMPNGIPGYAKATGQKAPDVARELLRIAKDTGCAGAYLECVDYRNYSPGICDALAMKVLAQGDASWEELRATALARPRTFVYNTDGNDAHNWPSNLPVTVENFTGRRLVHALDTRISTVSYCPLSSGFGRLTCRKAGEPYCVRSHRGLKHATADLFAMGTDPLELTSQFCRTNGLEIFVSIRVNDTHDAAGSFEKPDPLFPDFKKNNPDCLMGRPEKGKRPPFCNWSAVDFSHEKVRAHMRTFVRDLVENYDLDGIEYDFNRHMQLFKSVALGGEASQAELDLMTAFMRELRAITEEVGRKKNHPILVVMRAPDSADYCRAVGIDLARWFDERLVDIWIGGGYFCLNPWKVSADFAHRHGVKFYASMDETRIPGAAARRPVPPLKGRMSVPFYAARFADAMASGCDGVYVFNIEGKFLHQVAGIDPLRTKGRETVRFAADRGSGGYRPWKYLKDGGRFNNLPKIDPGEPLHVKPGETCAFEMFVAGDSLVGASNATVKVLTNLKSDEAVTFTCNGRPFKAKQPRAGVFVYTLPADELKPGMNAFSVTFPNTVEKGVTFNDFVLRIMPQGKPSKGKEVAK